MGDPIRETRGDSHYRHLRAMREEEKNHSKSSCVWGPDDQRKTTQYFFCRMIKAMVDGRWGGEGLGLGDL